MVWVYERTGSMLVAMLMHVSLATFTLSSRPRLEERLLGHRFRVRRRAVGHRRSSRPGTRRTSLTTAAPEAGNLKG